MSIKVMSAIFATKFRDLKDETGYVTKARTAKYVLLALADHANENGEGAYPSLSTMEQKTQLARTTIVQAYKALMYNGIITRVGRSKFHTCNYTVNVNALSTTRRETTTPAANLEDVPAGQLDQSSHTTSDDPVTLPVQPLNQSSHTTSDSPATLPSSVQPLDLNRPLTTLKPSNDDEEQKDAENYLRRLYEDNLGMVTPLLAGLLRNATLTYPRGWFQPAFETAAKNKARSWKYIEAILEGWRIHGFGSKPERITRSNPEDAYRSRQEHNREVIESLVQEEMKHGR